MRKLAPILFLLFYSLTQVAAVCWQLYKPLAHAFFAAIQKEKDEALVIMSLPKQVVKDIKNEDDELRIDGVLYDIEKEINNGDITILHLKKDEKETAWDEQYEKWKILFHRQAKPANQKTKGEAIGFLAFFYHKQNFSCTALYPVNHSKHRVYTTKDHLPPYSSVITPPPKTC